MSVLQHLKQFRLLHVAYLGSLLSLGLSQGNARAAMSWNCGCSRCIAALGSGSVLEPGFLFVAFVWSPCLHRLVVICFFFIPLGVSRVRAVGPVTLVWRVFIDRPAFWVERKVWLPPFPEDHRVFPEDLEFFFGASGPQMVA